MTDIQVINELGNDLAMFMGIVVVIEDELVSVMKKENPKNFSSEDIVGMLFSKLETLQEDYLHFRGVLDRHLAWMKPGPSMLASSSNSCGIVFPVSEDVVDPVSYRRGSLAKLRSESRSSLD